MQRALRRRVCLSQCRHHPLCSTFVGRNPLNAAHAIDLLTHPEDGQNEPQQKHSANDAQSSSGNLGIDLRGWIHYLKSWFDTSKGSALRLTGSTDKIPARAQGIAIGHMKYIYPALSRERSTPRSTLMLRALESPRR